MKKTPRRFLSFLLSLSLIFGMLPIYSASAAADVHTGLINPGFEMDLVDGSIPGWSLITTNTISTVTTSTYKAHAGSKSLHFNNSSDQEQLQVTSEMVPVVPGAEYNAKAYANVVKQTHSVGYEVHFFNAQGTKLTTTKAINFAKGTLKLNEWNELVVPFVAPADATQIQLRFNSGKVALTEVYFDDVSIERIGQPEPPAPEEANGIINPGFEMALTQDGKIPGWSFVTTNTISTVTISTYRAYSGTKSLHFNNSSDQEQLQVTSELIPVVPGAKYNAKAFANVVNQTHSVGYEVHFFNEQGTKLTTTKAINFAKGTLKLNKWNELVVPFDVPADATQIQLRFNSGKVALTEVYFDDVSIELLSQPEPPAPEKPNGVINPGFEIALTPDGKIPGWSLVTTNTVSTVTVSTYRAHGGTKSLHFNNSSNEEQLQVTSDLIPVISGGSYNAKAFANVVNQTHSVGYEVHFFNAQGTKLTTTKAINFAKGALKLNEWNELVVPFDVPADATQIQLRFNSGKIALTEVYFDDVSIELISKPTPDYPKEILNPGFEAELVSGQIPGWSIGAGTIGELNLASDIVLSGTKSLHFKDSSTTTGLRVLSNEILLKPDSTFTFKASVYVINQTHNIVPQIYFYNSLGEQVSVKQELFGSNTLGKNKWTDMRLISPVPAGAVYAKVGFYSGDPSLTEAYFDDVTVGTLLQEEPLDRQYGAPVNLGPMVNVNLGQAGAIQTNAKGENEVYFVTNGLPGTFYVLDAETGALKFKKTVEKTEATWAMTVGSDKNVYFSGTGDGTLYRYLPLEEKLESKLESLGFNTADNWVWDIEEIDGKIYGGTYNPISDGKLFEYDIAAKKFRNYGTVQPGQQYVRGIAVDEEYIYAGMGTTVQLFKVNRVTGEKTEIVIPGHTGATNTIADVFKINNKLFVSVSTINMVVWDLETNTIDSNFQYSNMISEPYPADPNFIYYKYLTKLYKYDINKKVSTEIPLSVPLPDTTRVKDISWIKMNSGEKAGKTVMAMVTQYGEYILYDPVDNWVSFVELKIDPQPVRIQGVERGFDGRLYFGGYQRGMSIYNPFTSQIDVNVSSFAQPEGIGFLNNKVYYGTYVSAVMYSYDPTKPIVLNKNPELEYQIKHQDRPFAITSGDNKLFVGTIPDYGVLGGALAIYDEAMDTWKQYDQVVKNQSIIGLAYKDGLLYGGTSVWGGLGIDPSEPKAKIFVWDVASGKKMDEFTPDIPGIDEAPRMIGEISFGPDGLLWGAVDGTIFAMDVQTKEVVKSKMIQPSTYSTSKWMPFHLRWAPDGMLYTTLSRKIIVVDPETLKYKIIVNDFLNSMTLGIDGSIYYAPDAGAALSRIAIPETDATLSAITVDGKPLEGFSPGVLEYTYPLSASAKFQATATQAGATVLTEVLEASKQTVIRVLAKDGKSKLEYKINWKQPVQEGDGSSDTPTPSAPGNTNEEKLVIDHKGLQKAVENGKVSINVPEKAKQIALPANAAEAIGQNRLSIETKSLTLEIPSGLLKQLTGKVNGAALENGTIELKIEPLPQAESRKLVEQLQASNQASIKLSGEVIDFELSFVAKSGEQTSLTAFNTPMTLRLKVNSDTNSKLAGVYYIANDGKLEYVGGEFRNGELIVDIHHFSKYAILEYKKSFTDVTAAHWANEAIEQLTSKHIITGATDAVFEPERSITRAEFASLLVRALKLTKTGELTFTDVEKGAWYEAPVSIAVQSGIVNGKSETVFDPNGNITREEMVAMLMRAYAVSKGVAVDGSAASAFSDESVVSPWALEYVRAAAALKLIQGREANQFVPESMSTRAEAATILHRILK